MLAKEKALCYNIGAVCLDIIKISSAHAWQAAGKLLIKHMIWDKEVKEVKEGIHPAYYQAKVVCNCGNEFVTGSTKKDIHVEICSKCHTFYTGQQKANTARGRIEQFNRKYGVK